MKTRNRHDDAGSDSTRVSRVASSIRRSVQQSITRGFGDPRIRGLVSVTAVDVSPDLARAKVSVSVVPDKYESRVLRGLQSAAGRIRSELGQSAKLRKMPKLAFAIDRSLKNQAELEALVRTDENEPGPDAAGEEANGT